MLGNSHTRDREIAHHGVTLRSTERFPMGSVGLDHYALCIVRSSDGTEFFLQQKDDGYPDIAGRGKYTCFGGKVEKNENAFEALVREWREEFRSPTLPEIIHQRAKPELLYVNNRWRYTVFEIHLESCEWLDLKRVAFRPGEVLEGIPRVLSKGELQECLRADELLGGLPEILTVGFPHLVSGS